MAKILKPQQNFTIISNQILRDERISFKAKGLFAYMYSMDESWRFTIKSIAAQQKDGYAAIQTALKELRAYGYVIYHKSNDGTGIYELVPEPKDVEIEEEPKSENPILGNPIMGNAERIKNTIKHQNTINTEVKKQAKKEKTPLPDWLDKDLWAEWVQHRKEIRKALTPTTIKRQLKLLERYKAVHRDIIRTSIQNGWTGLFEPKQTYRKQQPEEGSIEWHMQQQQRQQASLIDTEVIDV